jgi:hypothetical protein
LAFRAPCLKVLPMGSAAAPGVAGVGAMRFKDR